MDGGQLFRDGPRASRLGLRRFGRTGGGIEHHDGAASVGLDPGALRGLRRDAGPVPILPRLDDGSREGGGHREGELLHVPPEGRDHPANWADPLQHGRNGAELAPNPTDKFAMAGFARCTKCHGSLYNNGPAISCMTCHTKAPHPNKPWVSTTLTKSTHVENADGNAPECAKCHTAGANSDLKPTTTPAPNTQPGCFNATLCHGTSLN